MLLHTLDIVLSLVVNAVHFWDGDSRCWVETYEIFPLSRGICCFGQNDRVLLQIEYWLSLLPKFSTFCHLRQTPVNNSYVNTPSLQTITIFFCWLFHCGQWMDSRPFFDSGRICPPSLHNWLIWLEFRVNTRVQPICRRFVLFIQNNGRLFFYFVTQHALMLVEHHDFLY